MTSQPNAYTEAQLKELSPEARAKIEKAIAKRNRKAARLADKQSAKSK